MRRAALSFLVVGALACGPAVRVDDRSAFDEDDPRAVTEEPAAERIPETPAVSAGAREATVTREALYDTLAAGPPALMAGVELTASFQDRRFAGWKIVQFMPGEDRFDRFDLRPGDVIERINGRRPSRPEHLFALWVSLCEADAIVVDVAREAARFQLRFDVVGRAQAPEICSARPGAPPPRRP